ncbi:MAG: hypothetical protein AAGA77_10405 [Bacteroidota bacterium]
MKSNHTYLILVLVLSFLLSSCSKDDDYLMSDEEIAIRNTDDIPPVGCKNCRVFLSIDENCKMKASLTKGCAGNVTYQWTTPSGTSTSPNPDASIDGNYCVNIFTDKGCWATACTNVEGCEDVCDNDCVEVGFSSTVKCQLEVKLNECDAKPKKIIWTTPLNYIPIGKTVKANVDGVYCAHVLLADGCMYTECINVKDCEEYCVDNCSIEIEVDDTGANCTLDVIPTSCPILLEIEWEYPDGTTTNNSPITVEEDGTYCVTVTQPNGCELSDCIEIENCGGGSNCIDFELEWVNFEDGETMYRDEAGGQDYDGVYEYAKVGPNDYATNPVAYISGQGFSVEAQFQTECTDVETVFIRGTHVRPDGVVDFPEKEIAVSPNGEIHYTWENAMMNGSAFSFPQNVEFHDPFEIVWEFSHDQMDWTPIHTSANPLYVARNAWIPSSYQSVRFHTYFRISCQQAQTYSSENDIIDKVWEIFENKSFERADGQALTYYGNWDTDNFFADDLILEGDGQCSAHSQAFLNCLKAQGINYANDYVVVTADQDGSHVGLLVQNFNGLSSPPGTNWAVDSWAVGGAPTGLPAGFDIEYVVIPRDGYNAGSTSSFDDDMIYSEIEDLAGLGGQNQGDPKAYFYNHQIVVIGSNHYDVPYGNTYGSISELKANMFGYIYQTSATISEDLLGVDIDEDGNVSGDVTLTVWLIDRDLDDEVTLEGDPLNNF